MKTTGPRPDDLFVCHGSDGEYVLGPMAAELRARSLRVVEAVGGIHDVGKVLAAQLPHDGRIILVTSAHFMHDGAAMFEWMGSVGCLSPFEVQALLRPVLTVYVPHDLCTPLLIEEMLHLRNIDLYLAATDEELMLRQGADVELVGWAKYHEPSPPPYERHNRALWLPMGVEERAVTDGAERTLEDMRPHLRDWCDIKMAPCEAVNELEDLLRGVGVSLVDRNRSAAHLVHHYDAIISNGSSSVVREAGLTGKPVFILTHPSVFQNRWHWYQFTDLPNLHFVGSMDEIPEVVHDVTSRIRAFDMDRALHAIFERI